ncbi:hypothetical protein UlMin_005098 [Ulmus minor]
MAPTLLISLPLFFSFLFVNLSPAKTYHTFSKCISPKELGLKQEKLTHIHFYFHDVIRGQNPTAIQILKAKLPNTSSIGFGFTVMADNPLTVGPEQSSKLVGKAQGLYASASQTEIGLLMVFNLVFTQGKYKGSTLSLLGRNVILSKVREMPIVGGTGLFRFARGYAQARTYMFNMTSGNAIVEYNVYVFHY